MDRRNASRITSSRSSERATWRSTCAFGMSNFYNEYDRAAALRHQHAPVLCLIPDSDHQCPFALDNATHALASSATAKPTFNVEEEVVVIHNGWTPKKKICMYIYKHIYRMIIKYEGLLKMKGGCKKLGS